MSSETLLSVIPFSPPVLSAELCIVLSVFLVGAALWLSPGGLAWALVSRRKTIPGPSGYPLLGLCLAFHGGATHRVLQKLAGIFQAEKLMSFSVGLTRFIISSDPGTAKELLASSAFADRPVKESAYELLFHRAMGFAPYGEYWRNLRRISATHMFSPRRIAASASFRGEIGAKMVKQVMDMASGDGNVSVRKILHLGSLNNVMMSVFGKCYDFSGDFSGEELEALVSEGYQLLGIFNWSDHFPVLGWFDFQGVRKRCKALAQKVNLFVEKIIAEHREKAAAKKAEASDGDAGDDVSGDFVDVLLNLENDKLSDSDMIAVLWEMIFRGTDTVAILLEWILARMVLHPDIQAKVQAEIDTVVGGGKAVSDADIPNLPYLQAVVKETLRVHPPGPLLSWARLAIHDTKVGGHFIPAGTTAMVNMWAITHDEKIWANPGAFRPERFMEEEVGIMGADLRLAPFGSGRRVCPGKALGLATVHLWLAQLLQGFEWGPAEGGVDLGECLKLSLEMKKPLVCKAVPRV